ncbi:cysteine desulfurase family protein [Ekhidna sp. To15]|uniref:cysteine desulfurase family protein n=1 Tax=Ekhidna sp. To15 TaxID=3395267 RepID=UPI003F528F36
MSKQPIYLDYNATTPVDEQVLEEMLPYFTSKFGNASSVQHTFGWDAEEAIDISREKVAKSIGAKPSEIIFTSGATEAINLALFGSYNEGEKNHIITSKTEHKAVLDTCEELEKRGAKITYLKVDRNGIIDLNELKASISDQTLLVSIMSANNETGVLQPMDEIGEICKERNILLFSDATQALGKTPLNLEEANIDMAAFSAHKMYGPKGVGALYIGKQSNLQPQAFGGGHEKGLRSGTQNVPGIVGFGKACEVANNLIENEIERLSQLRDWLEKELLQLGSTTINGEKANRLSHVANVSFENVEGNKLMRALKGLAVSQGSACNSSVIEPSHVLKAMGLNDRLAYASLRISLGRQTTEEEVRKAVQIIRGSVEQLRMQLQ